MENKVCGFTNQSQIAMFDNTWKSVKDIQIGDKVISLKKDILENMKDSEFNYHYDLMAYCEGTVISIDRIENVPVDTLWEFIDTSEELSEILSVIGRDTLYLCVDGTFRSVRDIIIPENDIHGTMIWIYPDISHISNLHTYEISLEVDSGMDDLYLIKTDIGTMFIDNVLVSAK